MESSSGLKTLNVIATTTPLHFRTGFSLFRQPGRGNGVCLPNGVGEALGEASPNKLLQVVLVSPQRIRRRGWEGGFMTGRGGKEEKGGAGGDGDGDGGSGDGKKKKKKKNGRVAKEGGC
ncbi:hypothetical protein TEA_006898 [Camellia sinensis var. sinensis]|uniref:Uncharacterized protein n=1 Tax=Camellia sinensis var. sinensis TaxID=542762 RepID=A0A4S4DGA0_CAMSN|nr:hypothetical protein TEA_006898 [Camellia sinensis var. sinensis]